MKHGRGPSSRRAVWARATKEHRRRLRQGLGPLSTLRVAPVTRNRYSKACVAFSVFVQLRALVLVCLPDVDSALAAHIEELWEAGEPRCLANEALAAVQYYLFRARHNLKCSWSINNAWGGTSFPRVRFL